MCGDGTVMTQYRGLNTVVSEAPLVEPMFELQQTDGVCAALGGMCSGSAVNTTGSCCEGSFCKYWQPTPEGRLCQGCYNCKCASGGPGATDDPSKCVGDDGQQCPWVNEC